MTHKEAVAPYLVDDEGTTLSDTDGTPYVDAIVDPCRAKLCWICLSGIMPSPNTSGLAYCKQPLINGHFPRVWWFTTMLSPETVEAADTYLRNATCTPRSHAWYERDRLQKAKDAVAEAIEKLAEQNDKKPGWSIDAK